MSQPIWVFLTCLIRHHDFASGKVDTGLIERDLAALQQALKPEPEDWAIAAVLALDIDVHSAYSGFRLWAPSASAFVTLEFGDERQECEVRIDRNGTITGVVGDWHGHLQKNDLEVLCFKNAAGLTMARHGRLISFGIVDPHAGELSHDHDDDHIRAPMPGLVRAIAVTAGQRVAKGDPLLVMEAMKMEQTLKSPA